jgi:FkbM family methyltransferase
MAADAKAAGRRLFQSGRQRASRSTVAARLALTLRKQANLLVSQHLAPSKSAELNGENQLIDTLATRLRVVVDVGANVGDWTSHVLSVAPAARSVMVEPGLEALDALGARFAGDQRVAILDVAASDRAGSATFWEQPGAGVTSSLAGDFSSERAVQREVQVETLDQLLDEQGVPTVDLLKVDAEGYDHHVLAGAQRRLRDQCVAVVQFEYNAAWEAAGQTLAGTLRLLEQHGYETFLLTAHGLVDYDPRAYGEFFGYCNFVAASPAGLAMLDGFVKR